VRKDKDGVISLLLVALIAYWFCLFFLPDYYEKTGKSIFPPEPEQIIEPAVISTKMIQLAEEAEKQAVKEALREREKQLNESHYIVMELEVAAYAPLDNQSGMCADRSPNITANNTHPAMGTIAVNPDVIPLGSKMYVENYGWGVADDTGAVVRRKTDLIEVFMPTYEEARAWGRRENVTVFVEIERGGESERCNKI
jgi:3D (Asp-Asp-Asp) domain-containing protein